MEPGETNWRIELFGGLRAVRGPHALPSFPTQKTAALLAYLVSHPSRPHPREELVDLLWPDAELGPGRNRLSQALGWLRSQFESAEFPGVEVFITDRQSIGINPKAIATDTSEFEAAIRTAAKSDGPAQIPSLLGAVELYRGELLPGHYDDWVLAERSRLLSLFLTAERRLIEYYEHEADWEAALAHGRRALSADPLAEELHCDLIRLLAASGQSSAARRQYREMERLLSENLAEEPSSAAHALLEQIRQSEIRAFAPKKSSQPSLLVSLTRFFGREAEITQVSDLLLVDRVRLVTLTGTAGAGKTRLAVEVAERLNARYREAVWFVPLADLNEARLLPTAVSEAMRLPHSGTSTPLELVAAALARRPSLLVLDNLEHLQESATGFIKDLIVLTPTLKILATSRHRLGLEGEHETAVLPLPTPHERHFTHAALEPLMTVESVRLFVDRARAVRPSFAITASNADAVAQLCGQLEGLPLALELCAAWAQTLTPAQMLSQLTHRFDLLVSRRADIAPRHRSLRAAVEYSFLLLPIDLQQLFARLSVFRGGWTLEAAQAVSAKPDETRIGSLTALTELRERSLITADESGNAGAADTGMRYRMLETLREFAAEQRTLAVEIPLRKRHAEYFLRFAETASRQLAGPDQAQWLGHLEADHDNIRAALAWSVENGSTDLGLRLAGAMATFWNVRGFLSEGEDWLERLLALPGEERRGRESLIVRARALDAQALLARERAEFAAAEAIGHRALPIWQELGDDQGVALCLQFLATLAYSREDYEGARVLLDDSLRLARDLGDPSLVARILNSQGNIALEQRDWVQAEADFSESLSLHRARGDRKRIASALNNLGLVARYRGDYAAARRLLREVLAISRELSDRSSIAVVLLNLGTVHRLEGQFEESKASLKDATVLAAEVDNRRALAWCIKEAGHLACAEGDFVTGIGLLAESEDLRRSLGMSFQPADPEELARDTAAARQTLGESGHAEAWRTAREASFPSAYAAALEFLDTNREPSGEP